MNSHLKILLLLVPVPLVQLVLPNVALLKASDCPGFCEWSIRRISQESSTTHQMGSAEYPNVKVTVQDRQYERVARNIRQVQCGQTRDSVLERLGHPVNKSEFESSYGNPPGSLVAMLVVASDWWFDGSEVWVVKYKKRVNRLVVCQWGKARKLP